jgi:hypothetical protein
VLEVDLWIEQAQGLIYEIRRRNEARDLFM